MNEETILTALEEVLGSSLTAEHRAQVWDLLGITLKSHILTNFTYQQFCGVAAMVERLLCHEFSTSKSKASTAEAKSEIEVADFDRLLSKIENLPMRGKLKELLIKIKDSGFTKMDQAKSGGHILTRRRSKFTFI